MNLKSLLCFGRKKNECDKLMNMSKQEKKDFLSNDLIERMIRVEQRVFLSFGEHLPYNKAQYYLSLTADEKKRFEKYLRSKKIKSRTLIVFFFAILLSFVFIRTDLTGNAINDNFGSSAYYLVSEISVILVLISFFIGVIIFVSRNKKEKDFENHFKILDKISLRRYLERIQ